MRKRRWITDSDGVSGWKTDDRTWMGWLVYRISQTLWRAAEWMLRLCRIHKYADRCLIKQLPCKMGVSVAAVDGQDVRLDLEWYEVGGGK